jgi:hypothetical protein
MSSFASLVLKGLEDHWRFIVTPDLRNFLRWLVLFLSIGAGGIAMYFAIYYGWISATPVQNSAYYQDKGNFFFYLALGIIGLGLLGFILLRQKNSASETTKGGDSV